VNDAIAAIIDQPVLVSVTMGFVLCLTGVFHGVIWWRDDEPGMGWCAIGFGLCGVWIGATPWQPALGPIQNWSNWHVVLFTGLVCISIGMIDYLALPPEHRR
jgi:uncharacterized membrane protein HdeD (DUF308 family)